MTDTVTVQRSLAGQNTWTTIASGLTTNTFTDTTAAYNVAYDYQVLVLDPTDVQSTADQVLSTTMGPNGMFGVSLIDSVDATVQCWFGPIDTWQDASQFDSPSDVMMFVPLGGSLPIISKRLQNYKSTTQRKFVVPVSGPDANGNPIYGVNVIAAMYAMQASNHPILYRDILGQRFYVAISNAHDEIYNYPLRLVQFDMTQVAGPTS